MDAMERLESKVDGLVEGMQDLKVTAGVQAQQLAEHMRRTDLLEQAQALTVRELKPLTRAHFMWSGVGKALAVLGTLVGVLEAVAALAKHLGH